MPLHCTTLATLVPPALTDSIALWNNNVKDGPNRFPKSHRATSIDAFVSHTWGGARCCAVLVSSPCQPVPAPLPTRARPADEPLVALLRHIDAVVPRTPSAARFADLVAAIAYVLSDDEFVWVDLFSVRQWPGASRACTQHGASVQLGACSPYSSHSVA